MQVERQKRHTEEISSLREESDATEHNCLCCHGNHTHYSTEASHIVGCTGSEPHEVNAVTIVELCDYINGGKQPARGRGKERRGGRMREGDEV